jgi:ribonuclease P protein component
MSRLVSNRDFRRVMTEGVSARDGVLVLYTSRNAAARHRLGVSITNRCGTAVVRNRLKRLVREVFRLKQHDLVDELDYVVMASPALVKRLSAISSSSAAAASVRFDEIETSFMALSALARAKLG